MAASDFVTEQGLLDLVTAILAKVNATSGTIVVLDIGANAGAARTAGSGVQYWICNNGVTPTNAIEGDLVYERPA